jgi:hypothetical protein
MVVDREMTVPREVRFAIFHDPATGDAYWLREERVGPGRVARWIVRSRAAGTNEVVSGEGAEEEAFAPDGMRGSVGLASWEIRWRGGRRGWSLIPWTLRAVGWTRTQVRAAAPGARFEGRVGGERVADAAGTVGTILGGTYDQPWVWVFGCGWDPPAVVEAVGSGRRVALVVAPARGGWFGNRIWRMPVQRLARLPDEKGCVIVASGWSVHVRLEVRADPARAVRLEYRAPDGARAECVSDLHAAGVLEIRRRAAPGVPWGAPQRHESRGTVVYERGRPLA